MKRNDTSSNTPITLVLNPFTVKAKLAEDHVCGGWDEHFKTAISIESSNLDGEGFVVENMSVIYAVRAFFRAKKYIASCEQLCQCIANICLDLCGDRANRIHVKVYNLTGHLELTWVRGQDVPPLPACVSDVKLKSKVKK